MWIYRLVQRNNSETSLTLDSSVKYLYRGSTGTPVTLSTADDKAEAYYYTASATSGTTYGQYIRIDGAGAGSEVIAGRHKVLLTLAAVGNAHGHHATLEMDTSAGHITGLGTGLRGNVVVPNRAIAAGTYYGVMAEIYPLGTSAALPAGSNACLAISCPTSTAMDAVANAISFSGGDDTTSMIHTHTSAPTVTGYIRILVNGAVRYLTFCSAVG
jgi:hypothetical protein